MYEINKKSADNIWIMAVIGLLFSATLIQAYITDGKYQREARDIFYQKQNSFLQSFDKISAGYSVSNLNISEVEDMLKNKYFNDISVQIFSDENLSAETLVYGLTNRVINQRGYRYFSEMISVRPFSVGSEKIYIKFRTRSDFGKDIDRVNAPLILIVGIGLCLFIFIVLLSFKNAKRRAEIIVANRTLELAKSEAQFRSAMQYASIGMTLVSPQGYFLTVNHALCRITGYEEDELLLMDFQRITHPDDLKKDMSYLSQMLAGEIETYEMEKRYIHKKGHIIWGLLNVSMVKKESGDVEYFISQIQDITQRKETENDLRQANEELEEFSYRTSHDLRSPLKSSIGLLTLAEQFIASGDSKKAEESLGHVKSSLTKLEVLVADILSLTQVKNQEEEREIINVKEEIETAVRLFSHMEYFERLDIQYDLDACNEIKIKPSRFRLVIENLISNAIKYQDTKQTSPYMKISTQITDKEFILLVEDNGLGIPEERQGQLFAMFKRFYPKTSFGSGLGLYMVQKSAQVLGGKITYQGKEGFSYFRFSLPKWLIE